MTREPTLTPFQLLPHLLPQIQIDAETFIGIRRQIHAQPELGFEVGATSKLVATLLESWGWRVPFVLGLLIAPVGLYIRAHLDETHTAEAHAPSPLGTLFREHGGTVVKGILTIIGGTVATYLWCTSCPPT